MAGDLTDKDSSDDVSRLFANLTAELEHAHEMSVEGQSRRGTSRNRKALLRRLHHRLDRCEVLMAALSEAIES